MYLVLLGFGALLSGAGIVLSGAGLSLREGTFDASLFTPGVVAAVGGLLLIGLGLALRALQRIERALAARATLRVVRMPTAGAPRRLTSPAKRAYLRFRPNSGPFPLPLPQIRAMKSRRRLSHRERPTLLALATDRMRR
jgi:hypothetical protein